MKKQHLKDGAATSVLDYVIESPKAQIDEDVAAMKAPEEAKAFDTTSQAAADEATAMAKAMQGGGRALRSRMMAWSRDSEIAVYCNQLSHI